MSETSKFARSFAVVLAHHAARRLPLRRAAWSEPMRREVESIEGNWAALRWALGCVVASYSEGVKVMNTSPVSALLGMAGLVILAFGGFVVSGGHVAPIVEALPHELMTVVGGALGATFILTSACGPGVFTSIRLALRGRRFQWDDYRALAATLMNELNDESAAGRSRTLLSDGAAAQTIQDAKALMIQRLGVDQVGSVLQSRIDAMLTIQRRGVKVLQVLARSLLWFGGVAVLLSAVKFFGAFKEPPEVIGGMMGSASTGLTLGALFAIGFALPLANRLDAIVTMDGNFYAFIRTAFVCRVAGSNAALAVRTANGTLPADVALTEAELDALDVTYAV